ncbi:MAG: tetratricopeptide repeat protein [Saprospiraceae bacterium]
MQKTTIYSLLFLWCLVLTQKVAAFRSDQPLSQKEQNAKIDEYLLLAKENIRTDAPTAMHAAQEAKRLSQDFDAHKLLSSNLLIVQIYQQQGKVDTAFTLIKDAILQAEALGDAALHAEAYHSLGLNYQFKGSHALAIESYHKALKINEANGLFEGAMKQLNNIGLLHREEENYELALEYLEKCLRVSREKGFKRFEFFSYGNIGYILMKQNKWDEALERFEKTLELSHHMKDTLAYCTINYLISDVKLNQQDYPAAKKFANIALGVANHTSYATGKVFSQRVLSEVYLREKKYEKARSLANQTLDYLTENSANLYLEDLLNVLYNIEYETKNYKKALSLQKRLSTRRDSLAQINTKEKISNSEYKYQLLTNEQENKLLKVQNDSRGKIALLAITIALLFFSLVLISFFAYRKSKGYNEVLEKAIEKRTKELENSNVDLAKSNTELERFAYIASHDLKTPLRDIVSFTGLLERRLKSHSDPSVHEYLTFIKKGGIRLNNLIMDTLEYSKLSVLEKENKLEVIDLNKLFSEIQNFLAGYIKENKASIIKLNELPSIRANRSSIILLFQNLIENSIKYNESAAPLVKISTQETAAFLSIFVEDNGIGISQEYYEEVFVMFSRLHTQNNYEGSGLGLSICKKIVDQLNGEIHLQSQVGKGSIFEIRLPRAECLVDLGIGELQALQH